MFGVESMNILLLYSIDVLWKLKCILRPKLDGKITSFCQLEKGEWDGRVVGKPSPSMT